MKSKEQIIVTLLALFIFFSMSIGYAVYGARVNISGNSTFFKNGVVSISSAVLIDSKNLQNPENPTVDGTKISFNLNFFVDRTEEALNDDYYATYQITISNDSVYDYTFQAGNFTPSLTTANNDDMEISYSIEGIVQNEVIPSKESKTFTLTINMIPNTVGNINVSGETDINVEEEPEEEQGSVLGSIPSNATGDLTTNQMVPVAVTIINTYSEAKNYLLSIANDKFELVDANGNPLTTSSIAANQEETKTVYLKIKDGSRFATNKQSVNIFMETDDGKRNIGLVNLTVPKDETIVDVTPPTISNLTATFQETVGNVLLQYQAQDNIGLAGFTIETYKKNGDNFEKVKTNEVGPDILSYTVTGLDDGTYYFNVIAKDTSELTSSVQSSEAAYEWIFDVVINISQGGPNGTYQVEYNKTYSTTITANQNRTLPTELTVTMNGQTITNYTYSARNGNLSIPNVRGNISVTGSTGDGSCLVEGTKILLADGSEKNVEDIRYDDLLMVWNYETGTTTKEYPIWIEQKKTADVYTRITFDDNTSIEITGGHSFFDVDKKIFVNYKTKEFDIGTRIMKISDDYKLKEVTVTNIETINKQVNYYFIASTRYWNVISNKVITTDRYTDITNLYPFDENMSWKNKDNVEIDYSYLQDVLPYYLYKGFRAGELAVLLNKQATNLDDFKGYLRKFIVNTDMILPPIIKNNERYWMVTTSLDIIDENNKENYLVKEGENYVLPNIEGKWYSTSENKYYESGDIVQVWTGMHFEIVNN